MAFTAKDVAALREQTGAGMMDCKKALVATDGDMEKAAEYLREQGVSVAAKKASRIASEGAVMAYTTPDGKTGAMVEINCESDFVGKSDVFIEVCNNVAKYIVEPKPRISGTGCWRSRIRAMRVLPFRTLSTQLFPKRAKNYGTQICFGGRRRTR